MRASNRDFRSASGLRDAHAASALPQYLGDLWERRGYVWYEAVSELRRRQVTTVLGNLWHLLNPAINVAIYFLIFGVLLGVDRGVDNFIVFLSTGLFVFQLTQRTITNGANSIVGNRGLIQAIRFPRALLPLTGTITDLLGASSTFVVLFAVAFMTGESPRWSWLALAPMLIAQSIFNLGAALFAARVTTHLADFSQLIPFIFRILFYGSGVIFNVSSYVDSDSWVGWLFVLNPMYCFITIARWAVMGLDASATVFVSAGAWSVASLIVGFAYFRAGESRYARV